MLQRGARPNIENALHNTPLIMLLKALDKISGMQFLDDEKNFLLIKKYIVILLIYGADYEYVNSQGLNAHMCALQRVGDNKYGAFCKNLSNQLPYGSLKNLCLRSILNNFNKIKGRLQILPYNLLDIINEVSGEAPIQIKKSSDVD